MDDGAARITDHVIILIIISQMYFQASRSGATGGRTRVDSIRGIYSQNPLNKLVSTFESG